MPARRILSLWFPRLAAERYLRCGYGYDPGPFAVVAEHHNMQVLVSLSGAAEMQGLTPGQPLRDAMAVCPDLISRPAEPLAEAAFLAALRRWAGKFSPWVGEQAPDTLILDISGCAHLFGGEDGVIAAVEDDCAGLGLSVQAGIADTVGAAWALARFAGARAEGGRGGDAIDQEARATRARAATGKRRHWTRGGTPPQAALSGKAPPRIAPPGAVHPVLAPLPVAALRLAPDMVAGLNRLGLRRVGDLLGMPRAGLARRFGQALVRRLDQALGAVPEPVSPASPPLHFAVRLSLPEPIGLEADILAGLDRLLPVLCTRLREKGRGARAVRLELSRTDRSLAAVEVGLARAGADPDRIRPLLAMKLAGIEAGEGIDRLRLVAVAHEPVASEQHQGPAGAKRADGARMDDLIGRIGARLGLEAVTRLHPADSHIPEKAALVMGAAWSPPATGWAVSTAAPRPLLLWPSEPVLAPDRPELPPRFRWRGRVHELAAARGPERIMPEWWLAEAEWRSGQRDYYQVVTTDGARLWLYFAHGDALSPGWFCHGSFA